MRLSRLPLAFALLLGTVFLSRPVLAEDILTICGCPPNACPTGYFEFAQGTLPLPAECPAGCASGDGPMPWWRKCTRCGDGYCRSGVENGSICGKDCCDANTPCTQVHAGTTDAYCRRFKTDGGLYGAWQWITPASYNLGYCSDPV